MNDPSLKTNPTTPKSEPPVEVTSPQLNLPVVEGTGVQVGGTPPSTQIRVYRDQPEIPGYEFIKRLGKGGMGVVWLVKDAKARRLVALKQTISDELSEPERMRFRTEAQAMAKLHHPNIVQVFDVDEHDHRPYFTMEYCAGGSLHEYLDRKPQPAKVCAKIVEQLARGMQHAHENGIIHRDLKPANVLVTTRFEGKPDVSTAVSLASEASEDRQKAFQRAFDGEKIEFLKITDFGLAKNLEASVQATGSLDVMGTPSYMAPEQGSSTKKAGAGADIWSLGVILYEAITGSLPFVGADRFETFINVCDKDPVPPNEKVKCPKDLETICLKCLRKDPKDRYPSAQALADDLRAFLEERSISARPMSRLERSARWIKKHPGSAMMGAMFVLSLVVGTVVSLAYADATKAALVKAENALRDSAGQRKQRAEALVRTLVTADPRGIPTILEDLDDERLTVGDRLLEVWREAEAEPDGPKLRVGLAVLPTQPELVRDRLAGWMLATPDPAEFLVFRQTLRSHLRPLAATFWKRCEADGVAPNERLRLLATLAAVDPANPNWTQVGDRVLEPWLSDNPLYLGLWTEALRPVRSSLVPHVAKVFRGETLPELRHIAASVLADYASDQPEVLADLLRDADDRQFTSLFPILERHRTWAVDHFRADLVRRAEPPWGDSRFDPAWPEPEAETRAEVEAADGLVGERFAFVQTLPLERVRPLADALARSGYRPTRVRPASTSLGVRVAAVWARDGYAFHWVAEVPPETARAEHPKRVAAGYRAEDACCYLRDGKPIASVLWVKTGVRTDHALLLGVPERQHAREWSPLRDAGLAVRTYHVLTLPDGAYLYSTIWDDFKFDWEFRRESRSRPFAETVVPTPGLLDASLLALPDTPRSAAREAVLTLAGSPWLELGRRVAGNFDPVYTFSRRPLEVDQRATHGVAPARALESARRWASEGFRPVSHTLAETVPGRLEVVAVWHRPCPGPESRERVTRLRVSAALALTRLGDPEPVYPLLSPSSDSEIRSRVVCRLAATGTDPRTLIARLGVEPDAGIRRGLIQSLGEFSEAQVPVAEREPLVELLLKWYRDDPDPGVHSAIDWLLRPARDGPKPRPLAWGQSRRLREIDAQLARPFDEIPTRRGWFVNAERQTFAVLESREPFLMGSPASEKGRFDGETQHWRRISRRFAMATRPVTVEEFEGFRRANPNLTGYGFSRQYAPEPDCPVPSANWFDAIEYCRWLSEVEGFPEDEMVYPSLEVIEKCYRGNLPLPMPKNYLSRKGYRLPTESEWEFAARAGSQTRYFFGDSEELLAVYGWSLRNASERTWPVGQKRPNDFGLFEISGSLSNWTHSRQFRYPTATTRANPAYDREEVDPTAAEPRIKRGGFFSGSSVNHRLAYRSTSSPTFHASINGLRVCRTLD